MRSWLLPGSALGGAWRGALLALVALALTHVSPGSRSCCSWHHGTWWGTLGPFELLPIGVGVGAALGAALAVRPPTVRAGSGAGRALALAGVHAAGLLGPLTCLLFDEGPRRRWIVSAIQATTPLSPSDLAARVMFVGSLGAALLLAFALLGLRRPAGPLGVRARLGIAACGLSVAFFAFPAVWLLVK